VKKLKLDLDMLQVDSFAVTATRGVEEGTVKGADAGTDGPLNKDTGDSYDYCGGGGGGSGYFSCTPQYPTNENTCQGSCTGTCVYSCGAPPGVLCA